MARKSSWGIGKNTTLALGLLFVVSNPINAAGFALNDQSVTYLGNAYAGTASAAQDASTNYYNPAGLGELQYSQIVLSGTYFDQNTRLYNASALDSIGFALPGNSTCKPKTNMVIPAGHLAWRVSKDFSLGISVVEPFGLNTQYSDTDVARLMATKNKITTVDISPAFGYRFNQYLSVGAGLDVMKVNQTISSGIAWGNGPGEDDGFVINSADSWVWGYHVGVLLHPWRNANVGLAYFSRFSPKFSGFTQSAETFDFFNTSEFSTTLDLPDHVNFGITQHFNRKWSGLAEVEWTHWSRLKYMQFNYNSAAVPGIESFYFRNTWRASLGGDYRPTGRIVLKAGFAYDQSPVTNANRTAMIPDSDRYLLALGAKFAFNRYLSVVAGYAYTFFHNGTIAQTGLNNALNPGIIGDNLSILNAQVKNSANTVGLQLNWNFIGDKAKVKSKSKSKSKSKASKTSKR